MARSFDPVWDGDPSTYHDWLQSLRPLTKGEYPVKNDVCTKYDELFGQSKSKTLVERCKTQAEFVFAVTVATECANRGYDNERVDKTVEAALADFRSLPVS